MHGFGASNLSDIITSAIINRKSFLVLLDKDKGGIDAERKYKKDFDCIWQVFLEVRQTFLSDLFKKKTITNIQSLLKDEDRKKLCSLVNIDFIETDYDGSKKKKQ